MFPASTDFSLVESDNFYLYIAPKILKDISASQIWDWWQRRRLSESILKSSIASNKTNIVPYFEDFKQYLVVEKADVLQANMDFFRSITEKNIDIMRSLWLPGNSSFCKSADEPFILAGYEDIILGWQKKFREKNKYSAPYNINLKFLGDLAVVTCIASDVRKQASGKSGLSRMYVTNVFVRPPDTDRYCLVGHISSKTPDSLSNADLMKVKRSYTDPAKDSRSQKKESGRMILQKLFNAGDC